MMRYLCDVWVAMLAWRCQCLVYYHSWHHHLTESQVWLLLRLLLSPRTVCHELHSLHWTPPPQAGIYSSHHLSSSISTRSLQAFVNISSVKLSFIMIVIAIVSWSWCRCWMRKRKYSGLIWSTSCNQPLQSWAAAGDHRWDDECAGVSYLPRPGVMPAHTRDHSPTLVSSL